MQMLSPRYTEVEWPKYQATHDTYFDLTCSPILAASHFNTARIENGDAPFFSKFASEVCAGTRTCVGKTPLCSEMYFQTPVLELWGKKRGEIEM